MKILIVDDEPVARSVLAELLEEIPGVALAGQAANSAAALDLIARLGPDLLLLDIHMPGVDGLTLARSLRGDRAPLVVYVTAYEKHALAAFDSGAVDYLLKPVRKERLATAIDKARALLAGRQPAAPMPPPVEPDRRLAGRVRGRESKEIHLIDPRDVIAFRAAAGEVTILTATGQFLSDHSLKALEARFPPPRFRRIHRAVIVNTDHLRSLSPLSSKRWLLRLSNGMEATVSKRMAGAIRDATRW
jgi:two-component system response regulator AlgR